MTRQFSPITLGERLQTTNAAGFVLTETTHQPNHDLPRHNHELPNIAFVLNGSFTEILDGRSIDCYPQSLLVKPAGEVLTKLGMFQGGRRRAWECASTGNFASWTRLPLSQLRD